MMQSDNWIDHVRQMLGAAEFFAPYFDEELGVPRAMEDLRNTAIAWFKEQRYGAPILFGLTSLLAESIDGRMQEHEDVEQAVLDLEDSLLKSLVDKIRRASSWENHFHVARCSLDALDSIPWRLDIGLFDSAKRQRIVEQRLEAEAIARHLEGRDGGRFLYGFAKLLANYLPWYQKLEAEIQALEPIELAGPIQLDGIEPVKLDEIDAEEPEPLDPPDLNPTIH